MAISFSKRTFYSKIYSSEFHLQCISKCIYINVSFSKHQNQNVIPCVWIMKIFIVCLIVNTNKYI